MGACITGEMSAMNLTHVKSHDNRQSLYDAQH